MSDDKPEVETRWWVVAPDGTDIEGPFYFKDAALMMLSMHPTCRVESRKQVKRGDRS